MNRKGFEHLVPHASTTPQHARPMVCLLHGYTWIFSEFEAQPWKLRLIFLDPISRSEKSSGKSEFSHLQSQVPAGEAEVPWVGGICFWMFSASDLFDDWFDLCQEPLPLQWLSLKFIEILMLYVYVPICSSFRTPKRFPWHASLGLEIHLRCTVLQALLWPESAGATASTSRSVDQRERLIARASPAIVPISGWCFAPTENFQL